MRIIAVTIASLLVSFIIFLTVKFWGQSHVYPDFKHPLFTAGEQANGPLIFIKPSFANLEQAIKDEPNLYLDVVSTVDGRLAIAKKEWSPKIKPIRNSTYEEIKNDLILIYDLKDILPQKKVIFNIAENAQAGHAIFLEEIKKANLGKGENFIVTSPYEAMASALKELAPTFIYGSTQPEILKIAAMRSMYLLEALNLRADVVIYPLKIRNQDFFGEDLLNELKRRHKRFIVGPIEKEELPQAEALKPFGIIINK